MRSVRSLCIGLLLVWSAAVTRAEDCLPGTQPLRLPPSATSEELVPAQLKQVNDYFLRRIAEATQSRQEQWKPDFTSAAAYDKSLAAHRANCRAMLGLDEGEVHVAQAKGETVAQSADCRVERITIPIRSRLSARGLLFAPNRGTRHPAIIICPDADTWPERFAGLSDSQTPKWLSDLVARGVLVFIPQSIERLVDHPFCQTTKGKDRRWVLYRLGYVVGRTMPGLDVADTLAAIDYLAQRPDADLLRIGLAGIGQGGMTALYAAAVDRRVAAAAVADYFQVRDGCWQEPVDRRLWAQPLEFGDAEVAALVTPRFLALVHRSASTIAKDSVTAEAQRAARFYEGLKAGDRLKLVTDVAGAEITAKSIALLGEGLALPKPRQPVAWPAVHVPEDQAKAVRDRHFTERLDYLYARIEAAEAIRQQRWGLTARPASDFEKTKAAMLEDYRKLCGEVQTAGTPLAARTQLLRTTDKFKEYRVMLGIAPGVEMSGHLLVPLGIDGRVPAVICQHGFGGTPEMITGFRMNREDTVYHEFGRYLAEQGYVVFAPLVMHRTPSEVVNQQSRKASVVGMMRVAMVVAKTRRVVDFLETLPFVDGKRVGYYGLSYGGYSAIWVSPLEPRLAATVISGHFNDWRAKITTTLSTSYLCHPDEDFCDWDVLDRITHVELVTMIAPRPACIEFGQRDGITTPEWTARAWGQLSAVRDHLGLADRIILAHYDGVHEIHGVEAVDFLDRFLRPERPVGRDCASPPPLSYALDSRPQTRLRGYFWIPAGASQLRGMAMRLSRAGNPGALEVRFGTAPGKDDLGIGRLAADAVSPSGDKFYEVRIDPRPVVAGALVHYDILATSGEAPQNHYAVYGPRPLGGQEMPHRFALSYRVLTDRAQDALTGTESRR